MSDDRRTLTLFAVGEPESEVEEVTIGYLKEIVAGIDSDYDHMPVVLATGPDWDLVPVLAGVLLPSFGVLCFSGDSTDEAEEQEEETDEDIHANSGKQGVVIEGEFSEILEDLPAEIPDGAEAAA